MKIILSMLLILSQITLFASSKYEEKQLYGKWNMNKVEMLDETISLKLVGQEIYNKRNETNGNLEIQLILNENNTLVMKTKIKTSSKWFLRNDYLYEENISFDIGEIEIIKKREDNNAHLELMKMILVFMADEAKKNPIEKSKIANITKSKIEFIEDNIKIVLTRD